MSVPRMQAAWTACFPTFEESEKWLVLNVV